MRLSPHKQTLDQIQESERRRHSLERLTTPRVPGNTRLKAAGAPSVPAAETCCPFPVGPFMRDRFGFYHCRTMRKNTLLLVSGIDMRRLVPTCVGVPPTVLQVDPGVTLPLLCSVK